MPSPGAQHRTNLPIPDQPHVGLTTIDARHPDTMYPPIKELRPPAGAPNVGRLVSGELIEDDEASDGAPMIEMS